MASKIEITRTISRTLVKYVTLKWGNDGKPEMVNREISYDGIITKENAQAKVSKMDSTARVVDIVHFDDVYGWYLDEIMPLAHKVVRPASQQKKEV
jgi:hypothetical protein